MLFFLGILLAVSARHRGHLTQVATALRESLGHIYAINYAIGLLSAVVDNVPLVAGAMKMYPLVSEKMLAATAAEELGWMSQFVVDGNFWEMLAYCAGTGGSTLIIGSAAGVAAMGMEKISFTGTSSASACWPSSVTLRAPRPTSACSPCAERSEPGQSQSPQTTARDLP